MLLQALFAAELFAALVELVGQVVEFDRGLGAVEVFFLARTRVPASIFLNRPSASLSPSRSACLRCSASFLRAASAAVLICLATTAGDTGSRLLVAFEGLKTTINRNAIAAGIRGSRSVS